MITTLVAIAVFIAFALKEAHEDRKGKPVDAHAPDWVDRATFAFVVAVCCAYANIYTTDATVWGFLWKLLGFGLIAYGVFTPVFRWRLNYWREMSPWYISPSSWYDWQFMLLERNHFVGDRKKDQADHDELYHANLFYKADIHRAGMIAYACELTAAAIGCWIINA